jgi:hypothetical protein
MLLFKLLWCFKLKIESEPVVFLWSFCGFHAKSNLNLPCTLLKSEFLAFSLKKFEPNMQDLLFSNLLLQAHNFWKEGMGVFQFVSQPAV